VSLARPVASNIIPRGLINLVSLSSRVIAAHPEETRLPKIPLAKLGLPPQEIPSHAHWHALLADHRGRRSPPWYLPVFDAVTPRLAVPFAWAGLLGPQPNALASRGVGCWARTASQLLNK
jgi:hypothetical protein